MSEVSPRGHWGSDNDFPPWPNLRGAPWDIVWVGRAETVAIPGSHHCSSLWQYRVGTLTLHLRAVDVMFRREGQDGGSAVEPSIQVMSQSLLPFSLPCDLGALGLKFPICKTGIILIMLRLLWVLNEIVLGIWQPQKLLTVSVIPEKHMHIQNCAVDFGGGLYIPQI